MAGSDIGDDHKEYFAGDAALKAAGEDNTMNQFVGSKVSGGPQAASGARKGRVLTLPFLCGALRIRNPRTDH